MSDDFREKLWAKWSEGKRVCVGLDPDRSKLPNCISELGSPHDVYVFLEDIVGSTADVAATYKVNLAFFLRDHSQSGIEALRYIITRIHERYSTPVILDAKWGDIGNTNDGYTDFAFQQLQADAVTLHPYMGEESLRPFLDYPGKGCFVLCRTSNPGAGEFQDYGAAKVSRLSGSPESPREHEVYSKDPLYLGVAKAVHDRWNSKGRCLGLVTGATSPGEIAKIREVAFDQMPLLIPGVGAQGGDLEAAVRAGGRHILVNASRSILYASSGTDYAEAARTEVLRMHAAINAALEQR